MPGDGEMNQVPGELEELALAVLGVLREFFGCGVIVEVDVEHGLPGSPAKTELEILVAMRVEPNELIVRQQHALAEYLRPTLV